MNQHRRENYSSLQFFLKILQMSFTWISIVEKIILLCKVGWKFYKWASKKLIEEWISVTSLIYNFTLIWIHMNFGRLSLIGHWNAGRWFSSETLIVNAWIVIIHPQSLEMATNLSKLLSKHLFFILITSGSMYVKVPKTCDWLFEWFTS